MPILKLDDCEIYYEEHGEGPPLLFVAGLGGVGSYWLPQIAYFSKFFRVIVHDHRGTGRSTKSKIRYSLEQMAADTIGIMDALAIDSAILVGHSTGGAIAQILCLEHPNRVQAAVMYATWTKADTFFKRCFEVRRTLLKAGPTDYVRGGSIFLQPSWWIRDAPDIEDTTVYGDSFDSDIVDSRIQALLEFDRTADLSRITTPVLVIGVENDHLTPIYYSRAIADAIPGAELVTMKDGAHVASQIFSDEFNEIVHDFILKQERILLGSWASEKAAHP
jgi:aminoacrylate hydrolase